MELSEYRIYLDVHKTHSGLSLDVKKGDTGRKILISLMDGGFTYNITSECFAVLNGVKPDGAILFKRCAIQDNTIIYEIDEATTNTIGIFECEIRLYGANDKVITSPGFDIVVNDTSYDPSVVPESEVDALTHLISEATTVITEGGQVIAKVKEANAETETLIAELETEKAALEGQVAAAEESAEDALLMAQRAGEHANTAEYAAYKALQYSTAADLAQNDPAVPGYIKNRTHWVESSETEVTWDGNVMAHRTYTDALGKIYYKISDKCPEESDVIGATIEYSSGTIQTVSSKMFSGFTDGQAKVGSYIYLRSTPAVSAGNVIDADAVGVYAAIVSDVYPAIFRYGKDVVHTLDEKFIPDTIARKTDIPTVPDSGQNNNVTNIFVGKTASFYGDSLTEVNYHYSKGYHKWVNDILGLASYNNYGKSGYKISDVYSKVNSVNDTADIIFVMCGVNDENFSVPLGAMGDTTSGTTYGALNLLCALLKQKYPTKLVVFITPHYQTKYPHSAGITSYEVSKAVREVCEKYAIPVYDNFVLSGIYSTNLSTFTTDNCHWNDTAHEMVGKNLARFMLNTFRYIHGNTSGGETHTHSYAETVTTAATCTTAGVKTFTCECGDSYTESIPATGHSWNAGVVTVDPTETTQGVKTYTCIVCGETRTETVPVLEHEHSYVDGVCSVCGATKPTINGAKNIEITWRKMASWHFSLYVEKEDLPSINGSVVWGIDFAPVTDFTFGDNTTGGCYTCDLVNDLSAGYDAVPNTAGVTPTVTDNGNGNYSVRYKECQNVNFVNNRNYWLFPLNMAATTGDEFVVSNYYVEVNGVRQRICAIGGAFKDETCVITDAE